MVTRSIVGRFLILAVLLASLGVIAQAAIKISQPANRSVARAEPSTRVSRPDLASLAPAPAKPDITPAVFVPPAEAASADTAPVRVVYPGPLGDAPAQPRKITDAATPTLLPSIQPAAAQPTPAIAQPAPPVLQAVQAAKPGPAVEIASAEPGLATAAPSADVPVVGKGGVNLNSASIEALNRLGGGHIGQAIVKHRPYGSVEDLMKKRVVRRSVYEHIKNQLATD